ncbi:hypothetical protein GCM10027568_03590 [Humibacter soli]
MDERRRLLERVFSQEGASEAVEDHLDPATGQTVRMTQSEWELAQYDRRHGRLGADESAAGEAHGGSSDVSSDAESSDAESYAALSAIAAENEMPRAGGPSPRTAPRSRRLRKALPYLAAVGGLVLGVALTIGIQSTLGTTAPRGSGASSTADPAAGASVGSGEGDVGATLAAVNNYFGSSRGVGDLSPDVTQGFDATSFHHVAGTAAMQKTSDIYAASRLDGTYCLVAVTNAGRAAETCGTVDDIARSGLTLTQDAVLDTDGQHVTVTVIWQTDGTLTWTEIPAAG